MAVVETKINKESSDNFKNYMQDMYDGKIKATCDEDCLEDCDGEHGNYELQAEFTNLFAT